MRILCILLFLPLAVLAQTVTKYANGRTDVRYTNPGNGPCRSSSAMTYGNVTIQSHDCGGGGGPTLMAPVTGNGYIFLPPAPPLSPSDIAVEIQRANMARRAPPPPIPVQPIRICTKQGNNDTCRTHTEFR